MEVILLKDVEKLGRRGQVVHVRDGYGRNFLLPRSLAMPATRKNREFVEQQKALTARRKSQRKQKAGVLAQKLQSRVLQIEMPAGEKDKLFGSVTAQDLADALRKKGYALDKKQIHLPEPIRNLGRFSVTAELEEDVKATFQIEVIRKSL